MSHARSVPLVAALALLALPAFGRGRPAAAAPNGTLTYKPTKEDGDRPMVAKATIHPQGNDFALQLEFTKPPMGEECKSRCANAVLLIDTDDDEGTGMQQGRGRVPTGADLSIFVQGLQDYDAGKASFLRAKIRQLSTDSRIPEDGEIASDLDSRYEKERLEVDGKEVRIVIDASSGMLPQGKTCRLVYAPPNAKAVVAKCKGLGGDVPLNVGSKGSSDATVIKGNSHGANRSKPHETQPDNGKFVTPRKVTPPPVDPRWGAGG